jgi:hypothetical protein
MLARQIVLLRLDLDEASTRKREVGMRVSILLVLMLGKRIHSNILNTVVVRRLSQNVVVSCSWNFQSQVWLWNGRTAPRMEESAPVSVALHCTCLQLDRVALRSPIIECFVVPNRLGRFTTRLRLMR